MKKVLAAVCTLLLVGSMSGSVFSAQEESLPGRYAPNSVIVKFRDGAAVAMQAQILSQFHLYETRLIYGTNTHVFQDSSRTTSALVRALSQIPAVEYVEPDYLVQASLTPNDTYWSKQWGSRKVAAEKAWEITTGSANVKIAVVDTGVDLNHPDLQTKIDTDDDYDFINNDTTAQDDGGHGTHVAGIAAAAANNRVGIAGMCPGCTILPVKVLDANGGGTYSTVASGIRWAADKGAKVINLSLGGGISSQALREAVAYANAKGAIVVCAAGNDGSTAPSYPAYYPECVAVAATDSYDRRASFSTYGAWVDTSAPGSQIYSTYWNDTYRSLSGTSMATPQVAGLAGLLFSQGRSQSDVRNRLTATAYTDPVRSALTPRRINAYKAVSAP